MESKNLLVVAAIVTIGLVLWLACNTEGAVRYRRRQMLTGSELEFYFRLEQALPECLVCPQIAVAALIEPVGIGKWRQAALERIATQRVGYAIFDHSMQLLAVVELDQRSRPKRRDAARERMLASAGIRTVRFNVKKPPSTGRIKRSIFSKEQSGAGQLTSYDINQARSGSLPCPHTPWRDTANLNF
jgi:hypothetical protein